jgi:hypothetical protein
MSEFEMYTPPLYQSPFSPIPDDLSFNFPMPLTPSDFGGSTDEAPLYSPRSSVAMSAPHTAPEKTHATSGVSNIVNILSRNVSNIDSRDEELKIERPSVPFGSAKKSTPEISRFSSQT